MFLSNLNGFNSSPSPPNQRFAQRKGSSKVWKEKAQSDLVTFSLSLLLVMHFLFVLLFFLSQSSFILCVFLYVFVWLFFSFFLFCFS